MKQIKFILLFTVISLGITSCATKNTEYMTVASKQVNCTGVAPQKCLLIKTDEFPDWTYLYQNIEGFEYQEGNEYILKVKIKKIKNLAADFSSIRYVLQKEISKTKKVSENLPQ